MQYALYFRYLLMAGFLGAASFTLVAPFMPKNDSDTVVVGIFPRRHASTTKQMFAPMATFLSKELGRRVRIKTARNFPDFWQGVKEKKYDVVNFNQYHYISSKAKYGYEVIAMNEERGKSTITGSLVVRKDSGINTLEDLRGRKVLFGGGPKAMQSYIFARYLLEQAGLKKDDYITEFAVNPPSAIVSTYYGLSNASAAGAGDAVLGLVAKQINIGEMKVLAKGEQYAQLPWAVKHSMDSSLKNRIQSILINLKNSDKGKRILKRAKLTGIVKATDKDFNPHRRIVQAVLGEKY